MLSPQSKRTIGHQPKRVVRAVRKTHIILRMKLKHKKYWLKCCLFIFFAKKFYAGEKIINRILQFLKYLKRMKWKCKMALAKVSTFIFTLDRLSKSAVVCSHYICLNWISGNCLPKNSTKFFRKFYYTLVLLHFKFIF